MVEQLSLRVNLRDDATLKNFYVGDNQLIITALNDFLKTDKNPFIYLWGKSGVGLTHLLQALCHEAQTKNYSAIYLSLAENHALKPTVLENLETQPLICLDDIEKIAGQTDWEEALFHLYNRVREKGQRLLIASRFAPRQLAIKLSDLVSRLSAGVIFQVQGLTDEQKIKVLQQRAKLRGFYLSSEVVKFLMSHCRRDMPGLLSILDSLDRETLRAKHKVTIPFIKQVLNI